jgi:Na+:H+ antiporter, NhaA family
MPTRRLTETFVRFFESEKSGGMLLLICTALSLGIANSALGPNYLAFWKTEVLGLSIEHWINDGLMAIFFLMIGLELERELYVGELSSLRNALLPIFAALGGMVVPALIHYSFNAGLPTQAGVGIPMATDIAFALGALALLGARVPASLKVFVVAFAVIDDLGAIVMIALFYTTGLSLAYLAGSLAIWLLLLIGNRILRISALPVYVAGGVLMWVLMLKSGIHATIAGVMLAFAIPFWSRSEHESSPSHRLENLLHKPIAFVVLPLFALANTGVLLNTDLLAELMGANGLGIMAGLVIGKPLGVLLLSLLALWLGLCKLPSDLRVSHLAGAGMLGGIGFTMSIFITNLAFGDDVINVHASKIAIFCASLMAGVLGVVWLRLCRMPDDDAPESAQG